MAFNDCGEIRRQDRLLARLAPEDVAMFRFLLEAYDNLALFTVLERRPVLLKLMFAQQSRPEVLRVLLEISAAIPSLSWEDWPLFPAALANLGEIGD